MSANTVLHSNFQTLADWIHEHQSKEDADGQAVPMSVKSSAAERGGARAMDVDQAGKISKLSHCTHLALLAQQYALVAQQSWIQA